MISIHHPSQYFWREGPTDFLNDPGYSIPQHLCICDVLLHRLPQYVLSLRFLISSIICLTKDRVRCASVHRVAPFDTERPSGPPARRRTLATTVWQLGGRRRPPPHDLTQPSVPTQRTYTVTDSSHRRSHIRHFPSCRKTERVASAAPPRGRPGARSSCPCSATRPSRSRRSSSRRRPSVTRAATSRGRGCEE